MYLSEILVTISEISYNDILAVVIYSSIDNSRTVEQ